MCVLVVIYNIQLISKYTFRDVPVMFQSRFSCIFIPLSDFYFFPPNFQSNHFVTFEECKWTKVNMYRDILDTLVSHLIKSCVICKSESLGWELHCVLTTERLLPVRLKAICFRLNTFLDELKYNTTASFPTRKVFFNVFLQYILQFCSGQINLPGDPLLRIPPKHFYYIFFPFLRTATSHNSAFLFLTIYKKWQSIQTRGIFKSNIALMDLFPLSYFSI